MKDLTKSLDLKEKMEVYLILRINEVIVFSLVMLFSCVFPQYGNAQEYYYGKDNFGQLVIINDSSFSATFYREGWHVYNDTGYYHRNGDTLFLSTISKNKYKIEEISERDLPELRFLSGGLIKVYKKDRSNYYIATEEFANVYDEETKKYYLIYYFDGNEIIVFCDNYHAYTRVRYKKKMHDNERRKILKIEVLDESLSLHLDDFPLLKRENILIPINKEKNEDCWINNGFYFPKMKKKKQRNFKVVGVWSKGLFGLPSGGFERFEGKMWAYPRKPMAL